MKTNANLLASLCILLLCTAETAAQPTCFVSYRISPDCPRIDGDVVLLGRVLSLTTVNYQTGARAESEVLNGFLRGEAVVAVEERFKGEANAVIQLRIGGGCYGYIEKGKRYIFNLRGAPETYYALWSDALDYMQEGEAAKLLETIRAHIRGERQPRIYGSLYNGSRRVPITGTTIVADKDGAKFESRTDSEGWYEFRELPEGEYRVYPLLPPSLVLYDDDKKTWGMKRDSLAGVLRDGPCGTRLDFTATDTGVISWRLKAAMGNPVSCYRVDLKRLDDESGKAQYYGYINAPDDRFLELDKDYSFEHLPPGRYLIYLDVVDVNRHVSTGFYYPGVRDERGARMIHVGEGEKVGGVTVELALPEDR
jgi:hypothetical protein